MLLNNIDFFFRFLYTYYSKERNKMKKENKKRNGFTLIELLAVIVILAVLITMAMPSVLQLMTKAQTNAFKTEAQSYINAAETAYADARITSPSAIKQLTFSGNFYSYYCITITDLNSKYISKDNTDYKGYVQVFVPTAGGNPIYYIQLDNGTYKVTSLSTKLNDGTAAIVAGSAATYPCPTPNPTTLPT